MAVNINNIYDIYNSTLAADQPFVDAILTQLNADIQTNIGNETYYFVFDLTPYFTEVQQIQRNRIVDRVLFEMRNAGIHCKPIAVQIVDTENDPILQVPGPAPLIQTPGFNSTQFDVHQLEINIRVRRDQEYMKTWC